jgi:non-ribosomal peptide synthetase component F
MATVPELLGARAAQQPDQTALIVDGIGSLTFGAWNRRSNAVARELTGRGVRHGDRIGLLFGERDRTDFAPRRRAASVPVTEEEYR